MNPFGALLYSPRISILVYSTIASSAVSGRLEVGPRACSRSKRGSGEIFWVEGGGVLVVFVMIGKSWISVRAKLRNCRFLGGLLVHMPQFLKSSSYSESISILKAAVCSSNSEECSIITSILSPGYRIPAERALGALETWEPPSTWMTLIVYPINEIV